MMASRACGQADEACVPQSRRFSSGSALRCSLPGNPPPLMCSCPCPAPVPTPTRAMGLLTTCLPGALIMAGVCVTSFVGSEKKKPPPPPPLPLPLPPPHSALLARRA